MLSHVHDDRLTVDDRSVDIWKAGHDSQLFLCNTQQSWGWTIPCSWLMVVMNPLINPSCWGYTFGGVTSNPQQRDAKAHFSASLTTEHFFGDDSTNANPVAHQQPAVHFSHVSNYQQNSFTNQWFFVVGWFHWLHQLASFHFFVLALPTTGCKASARSDGGRSYTFH